MFAGWDDRQGLTKQNDWLKAAHEKGDPMRGDLLVPATGGKPTFIVHAIKVPNSGNLDRVQIVKIWTKYGESHEKKFNVVWGGVRKLDATRKLPSAGDNVDIKTTTCTNSIGATELLGEGTDSDFDPTARETYHARVLEILTPRWSTYWAAKLNLPPNQKVPPSIQQSAAMQKFLALLRIGYVLHALGHRPVSNDLSAFEELISTSSKSTFREQTYIRWCIDLSYAPSLSRPILDFPNGRSMNMGSLVGSLNWLEAITEMFATRPPLRQQAGSSVGTPLVRDALSANWISCRICRLTFAVSQFRRELGNSSPPSLFARAVQFTRAIS